MAVEENGIQDYESYNQDHAYQVDSGVVQLPVASRVSAHRLIRLHGGIGARRVTFAASRHGRPPFIPAATDLAGDTLLGTTLVASLPRPNEAAGGFDWSVTGEYVYAQNVPRTPGADAFPVGSFPFVLPTQQTIASALVKTVPVPYSPSNFNLFFTAAGERIVDPESGAYVWPFLVLPPACATFDMV